MTLLRSLVGGHCRQLMTIRNEICKQRWFGASSCCRQESGSEASGGFLEEAYHCSQAWKKRLETPLLQKINLDDFFYDIDKRFQSDKVISAIDVDMFVNKVVQEENLEEMEELIYRLRRSPATADALPSTSYAVIRAFMDAGKTEDLMRILNDRWNYGVFVDFHIANILMDEFLKRGNNRDAAKVASLLMLEENFGPPTSRYFVILSCLSYLKNPTPEPWDTSPPKDESEEEVKVRLYWIRNPYFDDHFDLTDSNHIIGKTLALVSREIKEDEILRKSVELLGWTLHGKWNKVEALLKDYTKNKTPVAEEVLKVVSEACEKALAEIEASPNKALAEPKVHQFPGVNLDEPNVAKMWKLKGVPEYEKIVPQVKSLLSSNQIAITKDFNIIKRTRDLLSLAIAERGKEEIQQQLKAYQEWEQQRVVELDNQMKRFRKFEVMEDIDAKKKELKEKEEVIFFFDNEEEWMMRLPPDEQQGYKLSTEYIPTNSIPFVKTIPEKKNKKKKKKV